MSRLAEWLETASRQALAMPALIMPARQISFVELASLARCGGAYLRGCGLQSGDIAAVAGNATELAIAAIACAAADLALLPLDPMTVDARWPGLKTLGGDALKKAAPLPADLPATSHSERQQSIASTLALVISTSGSEGTPKAVMLTHANLNTAASASNERLPLNPGDIWLGCLPLHHIGGISILYRCVRAAATMLLHEGFDPAAVWRDLHRHPVTHLSLVPAMLAQLLDAADEQAPPACLRHVLVGGAALTEPLYQRAHAAGWPVCPSWGMSECAAQVATWRHSGRDWQAGQVGTLLNGFEARLGADNRLHLRGPQVMAGTLNPARQAGLGLDDGWLITADLGRIDAHGAVTILGRADDVLISGGVNIHPLEVESQLAACPGVTDIAVTALADPVWGDALVALVVGTADAAAVLDWSRRHLASSLRPRHVLRVEQLPRNPMGKIERSTLRSIARAAA